MTSEQRARAKTLANLVATRLLPGATASEFRTAGREVPWRNHEPGQRLLEAIHIIVEAVEDEVRDEHAQDQAGADL